MRVGSNPTAFWKYSSKPEKTDQGGFSGCRHLVRSGRKESHSIWLELALKGHWVRVSVRPLNSTKQTFTASEP